MMYLLTFGFGLMSWLAYGVARFILQFLEPFGLPQADMVALSFLAGLAMFISLAMGSFDRWYAGGKQPAS